MPSNIVVLTGSGISAESGINTFRGSDGLWENHPVEDVATPEAYLTNPELVQKFYNERRRQLLNPEIQPNPAHLALAQLEKKWDGNFLLVTQNVDDLHSRAGSKNLIHMHGELLKARSKKTGQITECKNDLEAHGDLRPHIVWFGEIPFDLEEIFDSLHICDIFISIGTSGNVYPAAGFVSAVKANGRDAQTIEVNIDATANQSHFDHCIRAAASQAVPELVSKLLN